MKWMQEERRSGRDVDLVRSYQSQRLVFINVGEKSLLGRRRAICCQSRYSERQGPEVTTYPRCS
jgi:hypothetical protein